MNDRHHSNHEPQDKHEQADQIVASMESDSDTSRDEFQQLGDAIRQSSKCDLPEASQDLRELVSAAVDDAIPTTAPQAPIKTAAKRSRGWKLWGTAAAAVAAVGVTAFLVAPKFGVDLQGGISMLDSPRKEALLNHKDIDREKLDRVPAEEYGESVPSNESLAQKQSENPGVTASKKPKNMNRQPNQTPQFNTQSGQPSPSVNTVDSYGLVVDQSQSLGLPPTRSNNKLYYELHSELDIASAEALIPRLRRVDSTRSHETFGRSEDMARRMEEIESGIEELTESLLGEQYDPIHENAFLSTQGASALSTFSIDVDTASYANMRRFFDPRPPRPTQCSSNRRTR